MEFTSANGDSGLIRHLRLRSATALVVTNMVGIGIFASTGFQAAELGHPGFILLLWAVGGAIAFCGALCYAELGAAMPEAGGDYVYLRETYGDLSAFLSGFISLVAGFSAPIAVAVKSLTEYADNFVPALSNNPALWGWANVKDLIALGVVWMLVLVNVRSVRLGARFNDVVAYLKIGGIAAILIAAALFGRSAWDNLFHVAGDYRAMTVWDRGTAFAALLVYVMYSYTGWNATAYVAGEVSDPKRDLPRSILFGTLIVTALYLGLNLVYLIGAPVEELAGRVDVALVAGAHLFGPVGRDLVSILVCVSILGIASAMTMAGPRIYYAMGRDFRPFRLLARVDRRTHAPVSAIVLQGVVTSIIVVSARLDAILQYTAVVLMAFSSLTISTLFVLRRRRPDMPRPFRTWGYPLTPAIFIGFTIWMIVFVAGKRPRELWMGALTVAVGAAIYYATGARRDRRDGN